MKKIKIELTCLPNIGPAVMLKFWENCIIISKMKLQFSIGGE